MISLELFHTAYTTAPATIRSVVDSTLLPDLCAQFAVEHNLPDRTRSKLVLIAASFVVQAIDETVALAELSTLQVAPAQAFIDEVSLLMREASAEGQKSVEAPIRTMASDMQQLHAREQGEYVSSQDAILKKGDDAAPSPDPDEARWGSTSHY